MAHSYHHAENSARKYGGVPEDYLAIHTWFDATKSHCALPYHRALRHHTLGIFDAEALFGTTTTNSDGRVIPIRWIGEQHVIEDCRRIPSPSDWLKSIPIENWMVNGVIEPDDAPACLDVYAWREAVATHQTILGFNEWVAQMSARRETAHGYQAHSTALGSDHAS